MVKHTVESCRPSVFLETTRPGEKYELFFFFFFFTLKTCEGLDKKQCVRKNKITSVYKL